MPERKPRSLGGDDDSVGGPSWGLGADTLSSGEHQVREVGVGGQGAQRLMRGMEAVPGRGSPLLGGHSGLHSPHHAAGQPPPIRPLLEGWETQLGLLW